ncbi:MAG: cytidylate kinase-like family protein [Chloroflexi bacterium]|nr:cytidylate kinase-like family protein [Chloroflexota bacterium]
MTVITIEGRTGSGAPDIGRVVAKELGLDYVDRLLLAQIAKRVGSTVEALVETERRAPTVVDRVARLIQRMLERSAVAGTGGDPYFGPGVEVLLSRPYREIEDPVVTSAHQLGEKEFVHTTAEVIRDLAEVGNVVILSRGGGAILRDKPGVLRVGLVANFDDRVRRIMLREHLDLDHARTFVEQSDKAQHKYFQDAYNTSPIDPFLYHVMWNTSEVGVEYAAQIIVEMARSMSERGLK